MKNSTPDWLHGCGDHPYKSDAYLHPEAAQSFNKMNADYKNMFRKKVSVLIVLTETYFIKVV